CQLQCISSKQLDQELLHESSLVIAAEHPDKNEKPKDQKSERTSGYVSELDFEKLKLQSPEADAAVEARKKNVEDAGKD
ncbi:hypothetical protein MTR67_009530, partial [Solanum verrucosum]